MINVITDGGAVGNGMADDHDAIQDVIDAGSGAIYFPPGQFRINTPLVFPPKTGYHVIGCGMAQKGGDPGARAVITWGGTATNLPMVECQGTGLVWDGLTLWGINPVDPEGRAGIGIKICNSCVSSSLAGELDEAGKYWFPSIMVDDCATAIKAEGTMPADSCAFGYAWLRQCDVGVHLDGTQASMFSFRYVHPLFTDTVFKCTGGGGRLYVWSVNMLMGTESMVEKVLLEVGGSTTEEGFFHLNGVTGDGGTRDAYLLKNVDSGDGLTHVRFTNGHFVNVPNPPLADQILKVLIDRSQSTNGQTVLELVGFRGLTEDGFVLTENVEIQGASSTKKSRLIVRDCEVPAFTGTPPASQLIKPGSSEYTENRVKTQGQRALWARWGSAVI